MAFFRREQRINWRAAALGKFLKKRRAIVRRHLIQNGYHLLVRPSRRNNFCFSSIPMYSKTSAASAVGRTRR